METLRHWYVTPFGGMSADLELAQIGINRAALETNTSLDPAFDRVRVTVVGRERRPLLFDRFFEVVALDERHPHALARSPRGEAVLPEADDVVRKYDPPRIGDEVLLNNVWSARLGELPTAQVLEKILEELFRRGYGIERENA